MCIQQVQEDQVHPTEAMVHSRFWNFILKSNLLNFSVVHYNTRSGKRTFEWIQGTFFFFDTHVVDRSHINYATQCLQAANWVSPGFSLLSFVAASTPKKHHYPLQERRHEIWIHQQPLLPNVLFSMFGWIHYVLMRLLLTPKTTSGWLT